MCVCGKENVAIFVSEVTESKLRTTNALVLGMAVIMLYGHEVSTTWTSGSA